MILEQCGYQKISQIQVPEHNKGKFFQATGLGKINNWPQPLLNFLELPLTEAEEALKAASKDHFFALIAILRSHTLAELDFSQYLLSLRFYLIAGLTPFSFPFRINQSSIITSALFSFYHIRDVMSYQEGTYHGLLSAGDQGSDSVYFDTVFSFLLFCTRVIQSNQGPFDGSHTKFGHLLRNLRHNLNFDQLQLFYHGVFQPSAGTVLLRGYLDYQNATPKTLTQIGHTLVHLIFMIRLVAFSELQAGHPRDQVLSLTRTRFGDIYHHKNNPPPRKKKSKHNNLTNSHQSSHENAMGLLVQLRIIQKSHAEQEIPPPGVIFTNQTKTSLWIKGFLITVEQIRNTYQALLLQIKNLIVRVSPASIQERREVWKLAKFEQPSNTKEGFTPIPNKFQDLLKKLYSDQKGLFHNFIFHDELLAFFIWSILFDLIKPSLFISSRKVV